MPQDELDIEADALLLRAGKVPLDTVPGFMMYMRARRLCEARGAYRLARTELLRQTAYLRRRLERIGA